jgi:hypothetical protein
MIAPCDFFVVHEIYHHVFGFSKLRSVLFPPYFINIFFNFQARSSAIAPSTSCTISSMNLATVSSGEFSVLFASVTFLLSSLVSCDVTADTNEVPQQMSRRHLCPDIGALKPMIRLR